MDLTPVENSCTVLLSCIILKYYNLVMGTYILTLSSQLLCLTVGLLMWLNTQYNILMLKFSVCDGVQSTTNYSLKSIYVSM